MDTAQASKIATWLNRAKTFEMDPEIQHYATRQTALDVAALGSTYRVGRSYQAPRGLSEFGTGLWLGAWVAGKIKALRDLGEMDDSFR